MKIYTAILLLFFFSCSEQLSESNKKESSSEGNEKHLPKNVYVINKGGCEYIDSILVDSVGDNLVMDKKRNLYFKTFNSPRDGDNTVLISRIYNACEGDSSYDLSKNIDIKTFSHVGFGFYKDAKKVFHHNFMSDGGNIEILDADPATFQWIKDSEYGKDKKHVFYQGMIIEGADPKTFKGIYKPIREHDGQDSDCFFGKDKKRFYEGYDVCSKKKADDYLANSP